MTNHPIIDVLAIIRPTWNRGAIRRALTQATAQKLGNTQQIVIAAVRAALNPAYKTPEAILFPDTHWDHLNQQERPATVPCEDHPTYDAHNCSSCAGDIIAGDRPADMAGKHYEPPAIAEGSAIQEET